MGVWLPLALADVTALLVKLVAMWAKDGDKVKIPKRSEQLATWALPFLSSSLKAEEEEQERREKAEKVKVLKAQLAAMQEKYGRPKNANPQLANMTSRPPAGATSQEAPQPANMTSRPPAGATPQEAPQPTTRQHDKPAPGRRNPARP